MYSEDDLERMAEIVNNAIESTCFGPVVGKVTKDDFSHYEAGEVIYFSSTVSEALDPLQRIFDICATDRRFDSGQFFHFKSVKRAIEILDTGTVQLTALHYLDKKDRAEYSEFFQRTGHFYPLVTGKIDDMKKKSFVLCFTKSSRQEEFWNHYAEQEDGVCLGMRYDIGAKELQRCVEFRDVTYDTGYLFDFINEIHYWFRREFEKNPFIEGVLPFARFYKRAKYSWEDESRISFDYYTNTDPPRCNPFPIQIVTENGKNREYIEVPLRNDYFTLSVDEIICGRRVCCADRSRLLSASNLREDRVWVRK